MWVPAILQHACKEKYYFNKTVDNCINITDIKISKFSNIFWSSPTVAPSVDKIEYSFLFHFFSAKITVNNNDLINLRLNAF